MRLRPTEAIKRAEIPRGSFRTVDALLEATNRRLAALTEAEARQLWPVIEDALRGVTGRIGTGLGKFTDHDARVMRLQLLQVRAQLAERIGMQLAKSDTKAQFAAIADMRHEVAALSHHFGKPRELDIDTVLTVTDTSNLLVERIAKAAAKRSRETIQATASTLGSAAAQGLSFRDTGKLLEARLGVEAYKAERLARTELVWAHNLQRAEVAASEGYQLMWSAATYRACSICGPLDNQKRDEGKEFAPGIKHPPAHPNCFPAGTVVRGSFVAGLQARYAGEMIEVRTRSGKRVSMTANHPVLTSSGMVAANLLRQGMQTFGDALGAGDAAPLGCLDKDHGPSGIDDVLRALRGKCASSRLTASARDLHGDGAFVHDHIDIVGPHGELPVHLMPHAPQCGPDIIFKMAAMEKPFIPRLGTGELRGQAIDTPASSGMRGGDLTLAGVDVHRGPLQPLRVGLPPQFNATFTERATEGGPADARDVANALERCAGRIVQDQIIEVRDFQFDGHVFDLQSTSGLMVAGGIVTSNCRCAAVPWRPEWKE